MDADTGGKQTRSGTAARVLVVAGADSSGGAGLSRDLETLGQIGLRSALAVTAITVQTDRSVARISCIEPSLIAAQMRAAMESHPIGAVKIGMLGNSSQIREVAGVLSGSPVPAMVLDPVIASSSGTTFLDQQGIQSMLSELLPLCRLVTPNLPELGLLSGRPAARNEGEAVDQAYELIARGARAVLIKGGHASGPEAVDIVIDRGRPAVRIAARRFEMGLRGTGCMLSSAIAGFLSRGLPLEEACRHAKAMVRQVIANASFTQNDSRRRATNELQDPQAEASR